MKAKVKVQKRCRYAARIPSNLVSSARRKAPSAVLTFDLSRRLVPSDGTFPILDWHVAPFLAF